MDMKLEDKVVLITGGSRGIGLACAHAFARERARIVIAARSHQGLNDACRLLRDSGATAHVECVDLGDPTSVAAALDRIEATVGPIEVLVNSAGGASHHQPSSNDAQRWSDGIRDKYLPMVHAMDAVIPRMARRGRGAVVNIIGMGGKVANPLHAAGGAANAALLLVNAAMARTWGDQGVRVNAINPGSTATDRLGAALRVKSAASGRSEEDLRAEALSRIPLGRYGNPEEIAQVALFLASAAASYVTGATVAVDGGASCLP